MSCSLHVQTQIESSYLQRLRSALYDEVLGDGCLHGTRKDIVTDITERLASSESSKIIWLFGVAGSGKSTIANTVARLFRDLHRLGSFVIFNRDIPSNSDVVGVVHHIAHRIAESNVHARKALCDALAADATLTHADYRTQFQKLLVDPLAAAAPYIHGPVVMIIDALDECLDSPSRKALISLIASDMAELPPVFRLLITSRPDLDIARAFRFKSHITAQQLEIGTEDATNDILLYLRQRVDNLCHYRQIERPAEADIQLLAAQAGGLFVWAATAYKFMLELDRSKTKQVLEAEKTISKNLDPLYSMALNHAGDWTRADFSEPALLVLTFVVLTKEPLTDEVMTALLKNERGVRHVLHSLASVLQCIPGVPVRALHASFCDYLTDPERSGNQPWFLNADTQRQLSQVLTTRCLQLLTTKLRFNICNLEASHLRNTDILDLAERIVNGIPDELAYAAKHWAHHLSAVGSSDEVSFELDKFFQHSLLHWLEVISLLGQVGGALKAIAVAERYAQGKDPHLTTFLQNVMKLIDMHVPAITESMPQVYVSTSTDPLQSGTMAKYMIQFQLEDPLVQTWSSLLGKEQ
ncbi:hypothetical protein R3P38DRAFT_3031891 [Favolaschia claudopus]|uniref:NACHT domain-containing protein n=1 Tax=Favolaschia claudopus TaxID=2862362 RepID=A0AAW0AD64_9AGAR